MATNNFKAFALDPNANVMSQADWEALPALLSGFTAGKASSAQVNKAIRQATTIGALVGQFIANSGADALDNADINGLVTKFTNALTTNLGLGNILLAGVCTGVLSTNGYITIPMIISGVKKSLIIQWGATSTLSTGVTVTLPTAFPTQICGCAGCESGDSTSMKVVGVIPKTLSTIFVAGRSAGVSTLTNTAVRWIVIGY
ncbi:gp53-like domain-containing protein [Citrobacter koseri]|uniref:gp53-like domain-containing protein n=1 Tax=Citrobacter koseri TaxID=545 RepID=UPI001D6D26DA|nr:hypothetical protein [Citrobacter koseri]CAG0264848.1 hypothetical protein AN2353V1_2744 [Citrobacter koseri]CAH6100663.1 hypothetical protein AN2353V1_2744 [Citrobacter koseri]